MGKTVKITDDNFNSVVKDGVVLVDFWAEWCGPCKMVEPVLNEIAEEMDNITIGKLNVDENQAKSAEFQIRSIPTMIIFKNGVQVDGLLGALPKHVIIDKLNKHI